MAQKNNGQRRMRKLLKSLPPGYTVGAIYVKGLEVPVTSIVNVHNKLGYFVGADCQVCVFNTDHISGLCFGAPAEPAGEEEEA